jgi:L-2-hydroxycarboxylate dehydrogenase (NAD+)
VELLSTAFQSGPFGPDVAGKCRVSGKAKPMPLGHYFLAIDINALVDLDTFKTNAGNLLRFLRNSQKDPRGPGKIWTAGEPEYENRLHRTAAGGVVVPPILLKEMKALRDDLPGLAEKYPKFVFEE